uniref:Uncharacterized protein n=1 Tax=Aegilops tauschii subsp. strangulata TaxID=200361 RepID=A0A452YHT2_AEGTS
SFSLRWISSHPGPGHGRRRRLQRRRRRKGTRGSEACRVGAQVRGSRGRETQSKVAAGVRRRGPEAERTGSAGAAPASCWSTGGRHRMDCVAARRRRLLQLPRHEGDDVPRPDHPWPDKIWKVLRFVLILRPYALKLLVFQECGIPVHDMKQGMS